MMYLLNENLTAEDIRKLHEEKLEAMKRFGDSIIENVKKIKDPVDRYQYAMQVIPLFMQAWVL